MDFGKEMLVAGTHVPFILVQVPDADEFVELVNAAREVVPFWAA